MRACFPPRLAAGAVVLFALLVAPAARAQVHWDVGAEAGLMKRFVTGSEAGAPDPGFGPVVQLQGHVALVPMVRIGAYASADVSPEPNGGARTFYEGGLHLKVAPPLLSAPWRVWLFAGFGYAATYTASYHHPVTINGPPVDVLFDGAGGGMLDVPLGVGLGYKRAGVGVPWLIFAELGGRLGVAFFGRMYDGDGQSGRGNPPLFDPFEGKDSFALTVTVGLSLEQ